MKKFIILMVLIFSFIGCSNSQPNLYKAAEHEIGQEVRRESIYKKIYNSDKKAYVNGEESPFTGIFTMRYIGHLLYLEEFKDGVQNGKAVWFGNDGTVGMRKNYKNGVLDGEQFTYYQNGKIRSKMSYVDGKLEGVIEWYDQNGNAFDSKIISNGEGEYINYWNNGRVKEKGQYLNWKKSGIWKFYSEEGKIQKEISYSQYGYPIKTKWYR